MADHDHGYKLIFSHPEVVRDLLLGFVREDWVRKLDFDTLERVGGSFVAEDLRGRENDVLWRVRFGDRWLYVYLLLEFQATVDRFMALRVLTYVALLYQDLARGEQLGPDGLLPPVLPLVLYNGERPWNAAVEMKDLVAKVPGLGRYAPRMRHLLLDEKRLESLDPSLRNLAGALFDFERSRTTDDILLTVQRLLAWLDGPGGEAIRRAFAIWLRRVLSETRGRPVDVEDLTEVRSMLVERAREWVEEWKREGLEQGIERGQLRGEANLLLRLLERKFGGVSDELEARVRRAGFDELHLWGERVLVAGTLAEVFED
jgi:hypothetical protein